MVNRVKRENYSYKFAYSTPLERGNVYATANVLKSFGYKFLLYATETHVHVNMLKRGDEAKLMEYLIKE